MIFLLNYISLSEVWTERLIMMYIYLLALYFAIKERLFLFLNPRMIQKMDCEMSESKVHAYSRKMALVTGSDGTIGKEVVLNLLNQGFTVHALVGDLEKSRKMFHDQLSEGHLKLFEVNLLKPTEVVEFGRSYGNSSATFHLVVLSAGIMLAKEKYVDDVESHMCVNVVSQALLLDLLKGRFIPETRFVVLSSACSHAAYIRDPFKDNLLGNYHGPYQAYAISKFVLSLYVYMLSRKSGMKIVSIHPGVVPGTLYRNLGTVMMTFIYVVLPRFLRSPKLSAQLVIHCALRNDLIPGEYYEDGTTISTAGKINSKDQEMVFSCVQEQIQNWKEKCIQL